MKPKNKLQEQIVKYSRSLPPLSCYQSDQAIKQAALHIAKHNSKDQYVCLDCGCSWNGERAEDVTCPICGTKLEVSRDRQRNYLDRAYFAVVKKCHDLQVVRMFLITTRLRYGEIARHTIAEAFQVWITSEGKRVIVGHARNAISRYCDSWNWRSDMEIRSESVAHSLTPYKIVGRTSVIPKLVRNGFKGNLHGCGPAQLFCGLLTNSKIETLWKAGQYKLAGAALYDYLNLDNIWPSVKIAIRNKYIIPDALLWNDMLRNLHHLGKDLRNPKYVCPEDLKKAHDYWLDQYRIKEAKEARVREQQRRDSDLKKFMADQKRLEEEETKFKESKSRFLNLKFQDEEITITPLQSVREFFDEGQLMRHCVFDNKYYQKSNCLIFHAMVDNTSVATIELSLTSFKIIQCRGVHNSVPPYDERIRALINNHMNEIIKLTQKQTA